MNIEITKEGIIVGDYLIKPELYSYGYAHDNNTIIQYEIHRIKTDLPNVHVDTTESLLAAYEVVKELER